VPPPVKNPRHRRRPRPVDVLRACRSWLPRGSQLPGRLWARRHHGITVLLWLHVPALVAFGIAGGLSATHSVTDTLPVVALAVLAVVPRLGRPARSIAGAAGLVMCSGVLVHLSGGAPAAHFHFFVMMPLLMLYQDWTPFLVATGYVAIHHGIMGMLEPGSVYSHQAPSDSPWGTALVHGGFIAAAAAANMVSWGASERLLTDPLTGLQSRFVLSDRLTAALERLRPQTMVAAMFIDLDRFKLVNDSLGHRAGDELLTTMADRLRAGLRPTDAAIRFGGDEFVLVCEDLADEHEAMAIAERMSAALREPMSIEGHELTLTISVGIAVTDTDATTPEALVRDADIAMYHAKSEGRNRCALFDGRLREDLLADLALEADLRRALERGELHLLYQPVLDLGSGCIEAVEALLRWQHPVHGTLTPGRFIRIAEDCGAIVEIGRWMIGEACAELAGWRRAGYAENIRVDVNLSPRQLADPELLATIRASLAGSGLAPSDLCLEITEGILMDDLERGSEVLGAVRDAGIRLALDDFGTGHSSLGHLRGLSIDALKVDQSLVRDLTSTTDAEPLVRAMVAMGHALGLEVVAEGVETPEQLQVVRALGFDAAQGFILARPAPGHRVGPVLFGPSGAETLIAHLVAPPVPAALPAGSPAPAAGARLGPARPGRAHRGQPTAPGQAPWHFLYFLPEPHQQGSLRPSCSASSTRRCCTTGAAASPSWTSTPYPSPP
jgi:diguanylate cyclase (GGDEF)-like protein